MAECSEIEAGGEVRTIKDTTARSGVAANAAAIEEIEAVIPSTASGSNQLTTAADLSKKWDKPPSTPNAEEIPEFHFKNIYLDNPVTAIASNDGFLTIHGYTTTGKGNIRLYVDGEIVDLIPLYYDGPMGFTLNAYVKSGNSIIVTYDRDPGVVYLSFAIQQYM